ncbi:MAG: hypothetical protein HQL82_17135 [Magnetococcales bacterium]|nr:hypothetical protein [Magnetococcales bacterium]
MTSSTSKAERPGGGWLGAWPLAPLLVALVTGCGGGPTPKPRLDDNDPRLRMVLEGKPAPLMPLYRSLVEEGTRNEVLNSMQIGVAAMAQGDRALAADAFDKALVRIESIYAGTETAAKARSLWFQEGAKDFKGEAYERAMVYYYRGLLYLMDGDFENARASFKGGALQDAFAEEQQFQCDFALLIFLSGWASQRAGDAEFASEAYAEVKKFRPDFQPPPPDHNVLLVAETGQSPRKVSDGMGHYQLKYRPGKQFKENRAVFVLEDGTRLPAFPMEDIYLQATTRGGRMVDKILEGKAVFRQTAADIGTTVSQMGANVALASTVTDAMGGPNLQGVGAGLTLLGAVSTMAAVHSRPEADVRYWKNLPDRVHLATTRADPGERAVTILFQAEGTDGDLDALTQKARIQFSQGAGVAWGRSQPALVTEGQWHNLLKNDPP